MLLERDPELSRLAELLAGVASSGGKVVLLRGEAGIGKSSLAREFVVRHADEAHIHIGYCDDLSTPQPLGPFIDIARDEPSLAEPLREGNSPLVWQATLDLLSRSLRSSVLVIEDTQWADEATLDAVKFLGRRIARTNGLLLLTYRDGAVDYEHPLRAVIGELAPQNIVRMHLERLTAPVVASMVEATNLDADEVMTLTGGNPLFVTEVLASGVEQVPSSIQDSVLARAAKLSSAARGVLDLVSVIPGESERTIIDSIVNATQHQLDECVRQGLLRVGDETISFNHELTRRAIESALSSTDRRRLNKLLLTALAGREDWSQLAHHAVEAGDVEAIVRYAPRAASSAVGIESYREALAHFRSLEPHLDRIPVTDRAEVFEDWARSEYRLDTGDVVESLERAIRSRREAGDDRALGRLLAFAVRVFEVNGRPEDAEASSVEAVATLQLYGPSHDLAFALNQRGLLNLMRGDDDLAGIEFADRAIAIAEAAGDDLAVAQALILKGSIGHSSGDRSPVSLVEEGYRRAKEGGFRYEESYALVCLAGLAADIRDVERASDLAQRARNTAARHEIRHLENYAQAMYAEILVWKGDWHAAEDAATQVIGTNPHSEIVALRMLGAIQARRGRAEAKTTLVRMWSLAEASGELQHIDPGASVLAEYLWLSGEDDPAQMERLTEVLDRSMASGFLWPSGALAFWMWKLGLLTTVPDRVSDFYRWIIEGRWEAAADFWEAKGVPYERGLALMHGDEGAQLAAIEIFETLGATAAANRVRRKLLDEGVRLPRGKARSTREHAAGLTARQAEVLELLAENLTNVQIADRLFVSYRTVENHVAAILMKLDVASREAAVDTAIDLGILTSH